MSPMISNITLFLTIEEKPNTITVTTIAPTKAANNIAINPETENMPTDMFPPKASITKATPNPAPLFIPKTSGPANGLRNVVCNIKQHVAKEAPERRAVIACGSLDCKTIKFQDSLKQSPPDNIVTIAPTGIFTDPITMLAININTMPKDNHIRYIAPFVIFNTLTYDNISTYKVLNQDE